MMIFQVAVERATARVTRLNWPAPSMLRSGLLIAARQAGGTGWASEGEMRANVLRIRCGAVGAKSGRPVCGLLHTPVELAFASRNERWSRKNSSTFRPQRT